MNNGLYLIQENKEVADNIYRMILSGDTTDIRAPGQFAEIKLDEFFLRKPISVCDYNETSLTMIYKIVGNGTETLSKKKPGINLDLICGLGNGFETSLSGDIPLVVGGGVGIPPLYALVKKLVREGKSPTAVLGFNTAKEVFYENEFSQLCNTVVCTVDGSYGKKGFVTDNLFGIDYSFYYTCGPKLMEKALFHVAKTNGQISMEERMGCGFGACMGCTIKTKSGSKRVCHDGPVFMGDDIIW